MLTSEYLYGQTPDKLLVHHNSGTWYAFYDKALSILTNANGDLRSFSYDSKSEYRDVRRYVTEEYNLVDNKVYSYDED
jgi:hypothetical protein